MNRSYSIGATIFGRMSSINLSYIVASFNICGRYDMSAIEGDAYEHNGLDPTDPKYLTSHMRELPEEARKYLTWAAFFGET